MAGLKHVDMALDPAIVRLANMQTNRYKYFRWTPKAARVSFVFMVVIPSIVGVIGYSTDGKWDLRAKRRGDDPREY
ncbi:hypothetical protein QBC39DRAFT_341557 [Podospora conica]|nr:hypothetical protein QBC39DRAFT_341557 [Schizothecium conicum]